MADGDVLTLVAGHQAFGQVLPAIIATDDPGAVGAGVFWLQISDIGIDSYQLWCRNATDDGWQQASAGAGVTELQARQVGHYNGDPEDGNFTGLIAGDTGSLVYTSADGLQHHSVSLGSGGVQLHYNNDDTGKYFSVEISNAGVHVFGIPTADPLEAGALYTDGAPSAGVPKALMVSGGPP